MANWLFFNLLFSAFFLKKEHNKHNNLRPATLLKKEFWRRCFPVNFAKFLRTPFFTEYLWWLLLRALSFKTVNWKLRLLKAKHPSTKQFVPVGTTFVCTLPGYLKLAVFCGLARNVIPTNIENNKISKDIDQKIWTATQKDFLSASFFVKLLNTSLFRAWNDIERTSSHLSSFSLNLSNIFKIIAKYSRKIISNYLQKSLFIVLWGPAIVCIIYWDFLMFHFLVFDQIFFSFKFSYVVHFFSHEN